MFWLPAVDRSRGVETATVVFDLEGKEPRVLVQPNDDEEASAYFVMFCKASSVQK